MFHLQLRFHRVYQRGLCFILAFQGFQDLFVNRSPGDDVVDNDGSGSGTPPINAFLICFSFINVPFLDPSDPVILSYARICVYARFRVCWGLILMNFMSNGFFGNIGSICPEALQHKDFPLILSLFPACS